ncbi:hypothetical protein E5676_scaffold39G00340 [Cucumis melo var. makuwa]|uniref:Uncharacterized protein n=1 Tax=Cucumis melo var. makuwa TaxID=1194695 RepID=A0A5A7V465_CUCMM|nr:hypothetical protein E6C27_scaffold455G001300 [Cucumis melo var. makuwa]TYK09865.1 hypothetical protein E5676_scaffold39G00340 [Cucumis melo var. makuwa]
MNRFKLDKEYSTLNCESDEGAENITVQAIELTNEECAYLDRTIDIPSTECYEDNPIAPLRVKDVPPTHLYAQHLMPSLNIHPLLFLMRITSLPLLVTMVVLQHTQSSSWTRGWNPSLIASKNVSQNPHTSSTNTNGRNDSEKGSGEDGHVYEDHNVDIDWDPPSWQDSVELTVDPLDNPIKDVMVQPIVQMVGNLIQDVVSALPFLPLDEQHPKELLSNIQTISKERWIKLSLDRDKDKDAPSPQHKRKKQEKFY